MSSDPSAPILRTLTLNPAIDQTITLEALTPGTVHRARATRSDAGGKGINVAACLADWGESVAVYGVLGRDNSGPFDALFAAKGMIDRFVRIPGETRTNIKLVSRGGGPTTDINLPGLEIDRPCVERVATALVADLAPGTPVVLSGSLPRGLDDKTYVGLVGALRERGAKVVLDVSGWPLTRALEAPADHLPHCVKPNRHELESWAGRALPTLADVQEAAHDLRGKGVARVVVSLGSDGALFVSDEGALHAKLPAMTALSTVGAGDAMVAGLVAALRQDLGLEDTARLATAFAAAKLRHVGAQLPGRDVVLALAGQTHIARLQA
ncbi:1-phosphofructokinase [Rhodospirillum rubrum]|uniref:1-phosphofructokinase n=1 Tax=Rhodospirillum rubrum TaxID=1085 RepID=UPI001907F416|nr:1-phosphofructokinase [Rhodospirillum rubrum]MBK1666211.1 1-phosphofructokinase [Rhodospirillum rubrum]MBK1678344.1 1-phosphofructokinase [Rhodospirillum rubrum]